ncbi:alpha-E domain-containing protein [Limnobacter humi]|uniref:Alpha-E domain-containing protein n=1 Tax=Limnobacter humi TaxID=1778671 RepID=A0ABT1WK38_9BURK|nr:alpha-E domain-containing protein [Limnobacter humi]MCQ8897308.1 alpha-E domain-containing protein [Limnobacter humi]
MLSRTADHLFWMARYIERAENTARMLDVNVQTALLPQDADNAEQGWRAMLSICELQEAYSNRHTSITPEAVIDFMVKDPGNPSSIYCCLQAARENARAVRGALTTEVWETNNTTWLELKKLFVDGVVERDPTEFFEWVKFRSHLSRGVTIGTMLKDEAFRFIRLGTFLERADNTARLLDVKFHSMPFNPLSTSIGSEDPHADYYHWAAILRSVSAFEIYRKVYRDVITPERVCELLILRDDMPRSLLASINEVCNNLETIRNNYSAGTERRAGKLRAELLYNQIDDILHMGLHAYLTNFLERVNDLGNRISKDFLVPLEYQS